MAAEVDRNPCSGCRRGAPGYQTDRWIGHQPDPERDERPDLSQLLSELIADSAN